jgi:hypothetical protein
LQQLKLRLILRLMLDAMQHNELEFLKEDQ